MSNNNPLVSIIVPIYNVEEYLPECLDSAVQQTYRNIEIIAIIDGSQDNSINIAKQYRDEDPRIKVIEQTNQGLSAARNTGIKNSRGDFLFFLDSDDWLEKDAIEKLLLHSTGYDIVSGRVTKFYQEDKRYEDYRKRRIIGKLDLDKKFFSLEFVVWNKLYRKEVLDNIWFVPGLIHEDEEFYWQVFTKKLRIYSICDNVIFYRIRKNSIMNSKVNDVNYQNNFVKIIDSAYSTMKGSNKLKYSFYKTAIKYLRKLKNESIPYEKYEKHIKSMYNISDSFLFRIKMKIYKVFSG
ncbi:glycosyltransferase [Vibrio sp. D415a]|uniref:glycosyltransferase family 2 protein n=1 Tax=Vibrio TaxID=662 RepID=UPI002557C39B|nr:MULTISPECIES: glycosyltransferase [unclassified Vibrio]MDK9728543.1 glycosyltransferase [Vibrio sp. D415a]MDK9745882.1 glycosyltransferase [Vibrio sp. D409a]MDK9768673.1 glycosyltransferase [Vibrio sp. D417a]MDK9785753.1 glycosyltransferase [Vibrio sp. D421a]